MTDMADFREKQLSGWVNDQLKGLVADYESYIELVSVSGDASFRRYFRAQIGSQSFIAVDAPPENENSELFAEVAGYFRAAGVAAPSLYASDFDRGYMLLEDFGDRLYLPRLLELQGEDIAPSANEEANAMYHAAIHSLIKIQLSVDKNRLAPYDRNKLLGEMGLFEEWFCQQYLNLQLCDSDRAMISNVFNFLADEILNQAQLAVHRDYHSRNLLLLDLERYPDHAGPGIIDFQDAMCGAYTYDLVSLLRDCYIRWSPEQIEKWSEYYLIHAHAAGLVEAISPAQFRRDLDLAGLQRNFKVMGIFSRLYIRDNKSQYLADIPVVIRYFLEVAHNYEEMAPFLSWFEANVLSVAKLKLNLDF